MWVCRCVHTKRVDSAGSSVKPQSGQGAESDRIATSFRPGACAAMGGSGCEASADRVRSSRDANGWQPACKMSGLPTAMREARREKNERGGLLDDDVVLRESGVARFQWPSAGPAPAPAPAPAPVAVPVAAPTASRPRNARAATALAVLPRPAWSTGARWPLSGWSLDGQPQGRGWVGRSRYLAGWSTRIALRALCGGTAAGRGEELGSASTSTARRLLSPGQSSAVASSRSPRILPLSFKPVSLIWEAAATKQPESHCLKADTKLQLAVLRVRAERYQITPGPCQIRPYMPLQQTPFYKMRSMKRISVNFRLRPVYFTICFPTVSLVQ